MSSQTQTAPTIVLHYGIVKQVLSGDAIILRGCPKPDGPPAERQLCLTNINAPRLGRRPTPMADATADEPYAWEAREYLRRRLIGREVCFTIDYKVPTTGREYGNVYVGKDVYAENIAETLIREGLVDVRKGGMRVNEELNRLLEIEEKAKSAGRGKWNPKENVKSHVRQITHAIPDLRHFLDTHKGQVLQGVVEHVRDGSTLRIILLPNYETITLMISGIRCPTSSSSMRRETADGNGGTESGEAYFDEAKFYTESRLLQRDVDVILEGTSNNAFLGTVLHAKGNIAEYLLKEGFAKCMDWSLSTLSYNSARLKTAEKIARDKRLRIWKDFVAPNNSNSGSNENGISENGSTNQNSEASGPKAVIAKVVEIVNAECMMVKIQNTGEIKKIWLSSIRGPKSDSNNAANTAAADLNEKGGAIKNTTGPKKPLYDIPHLFEAREFLRKKLIGKKVSINVDYIQAASMGFPEKICCTVTFGGVNVAGALVAKGFATVIRYSNRLNANANNENGQLSSLQSPQQNRSPVYEELLSAESRAAKLGLGVHSSLGSVPPLRVIEVSGTSAKQYWPLLVRAGHFKNCIVEYVASGSRLRLFLPRESWSITFLLGGINCPKGARPLPGNQGTSPAEPFSKEALEFTKEAVLQHDVDIEVESMDRAGNVIGYLTYSSADESAGSNRGRRNLSVELVRAGLASLHFTADKGPYVNQLYEAQNTAMAANLNIWSLPRAQTEDPHKTDKDLSNNTAEMLLIDENGEENSGKTLAGNQQQNSRFGSGPPALKRIVITEIQPTADNFAFYAQEMDKGDDLIQMMSELRKAIAETLNTSGVVTYAPKKGDLCAAKFIDNEWYRAKIEKINGPSITVFYIDYGNREITDSTKLTFLPPQFASINPQAKEYALACIVVPSDEDFREEALHQFRKESFNKEFLVDPQYRVNNVEHVTLYYALQNPDIETAKKTPYIKGEDFIKTKMIAEGYLLVEPRRERKLLKLVAEYVEAQTIAKHERKNLWRYGDFTPDDAFEFGYAKN